MMMASGAAPDDSLTRVKTFPLLDHSELPVGDQKRIIDRAVISILQRNVPESLLRVPGGYRALEH